MDEMTPESRDYLSKRQAEIVKLLEALVKLDKSKEWGTLKELIFDKAVNNIERQILSESLMPTISVEKLYKLQGEWAWAKQHADTDRFVSSLKKQLEDIKLRLK